MEKQFQFHPRRDVALNDSASEIINFSPEFMKRSRAFVQYFYVPTSRKYVHETFASLFLLEEN